VTNESELRIALTAPDEASAERVAAAIKGLLPLAKLALEAELNNPTTHIDGDEGPHKRVQTAGGPDTDLQVGRYWMAILDSCQTQVAPLGNRGVEVHLRARAPFPSSVLTAYEYEVAENADEAAPLKR
jgi:hypothetical protein